MSIFARTMVNPSPWRSFSSAIPRNTASRFLPTIQSAPSLRSYSVKSVSVQWEKIRIITPEASLYVNFLRSAESASAVPETIFLDACRGISILEFQRMLAAAEQVYSLKYGLPFRGKQGEPNAYPVLAPDRLLDLDKLPKTVINPLTGKAQDRVTTGLEEYLKNSGVVSLTGGRVSEIPTYYFFRHENSSAPLVQLTSGGVIQSGFLSEQTIGLRIFLMGTPLPFGDKEQMALVPGNKLAAFASKLDAIEKKINRRDLSEEDRAIVMQEKLKIESDKKNYLNSKAVKQLFEQQPPIYCGTALGNPDMEPADVDALRKEIQWWGQVYNTRLIRMDPKDYTILWRLYGDVEIPEGLANRAENDMRAVLQEICLLPKVTQLLMEKLAPHASSIKIDNVCLADVIRGWSGYSTAQKLMELKRWGVAIFWHDAAFAVLKQVLNQFQFRLTVTGHSAGGTATNMLAACFHRLGLQVTEDSKLVGFGSTCPPAVMHADTAAFAAENRLLNIMIAGDPYSMHNLHCPEVMPVPPETVLNFNLPREEDQKVYHVLQPHLPGAFASLLKDEVTALHCFNPPASTWQDSRIAYMTMPKVEISDLNTHCHVSTAIPFWAARLESRAPMYWQGQFQRSYLKRASV